MTKKDIKTMLKEAIPTKHFDERVDQVLLDIVNVEVPRDCLLRDVNVNKQKDYIIHCIANNITKKIDMVVKKRYPVGGSCVLVPLGRIKIRSGRGQLKDVFIISKKDGGYTSGLDYYIPIYDNQMATLVLASPEVAANQNHDGQLEAHMRNVANKGFPVNMKLSYVDVSFNRPLIIDMVRM